MFSNDNDNNRVMATPEILKHSGRGSVKAAAINFHSILIFSEKFLVNELLFSSSQSYILGKSNAKNCDMHYSGLPLAAN